MCHCIILNLIDIKDTLNLNPFQVDVNVGKFRAENAVNRNAMFNTDLQLTKVWRTSQLALFSEAHLCNTYIPTLNHLEDQGQAFSS
jgi:hypothetical protein